MSVVRIATRRSPLALTQTNAVAAAVAAATGDIVETVDMDSLGDRSTAPLRDFGGAGVFVAAVREAVLAGRADLAVHSLKDLPTAQHPALALLAVPRREDPEDALVSTGGTLMELPPGARVGTGSPRRRAQLLALRPDLDVADIRGNVDTRLRRVDSGDYAAVVLARAGLNRLGLAHRITELLAPGQMLPAPGQGALAVECATASLGRFGRLVAALDDADTRAAVTLERAALSRLEAGCSAPMGAHAAMSGGKLSARVAVFAEDGRTALRTEVCGVPSDAAALGARAAEDLLDLGAGRFLGEPVS